MLNIVILAAEALPKDKGQVKPPPCLQNYEGATVLEQIHQRLAPVGKAHYHFVFNQQDVAQFHLDAIAHNLVAEAQISVLEQSTRGSACTALYAACQMQGDAPLLIISSNEIVNIDFAKAVLGLQKSNYDGCVWTFSSLHPRYSYVRCVGKQVMEVAQQRPVSKQATTGAFWYARTSDFVMATQNTIRKGDKTANNYFVAPVFNQMILEGKKITAQSIETKDYIPFKSDSYFTQRKAENKK